jgi:hypothetical protein
VFRGQTEWVSALGVAVPLFYYAVGVRGRKMLLKFEARERNKTLNGLSLSLCLCVVVSERVHTCKTTWNAARSYSERPLRTLSTHRLSSSIAIVSIFHSEWMEFACPLKGFNHANIISYSQSALEQFFTSLETWRLYFYFQANKSNRRNFGEPLSFFLKHLLKKPFDHVQERWKSVN